MSNCPLCDSHNTEFYSRDKQRDYWVCNCCQLVFVPEIFHLTADNEKAEYDKHQNSLEDPGYLSFLSRTYKPLLTRLKPDDKGLDYGCGPVPALATHLQQQGFNVNIYDFYYFDNPEVLSQRYNFITCTEVIEHIGRPKPVFELFNQLLPVPGSILAIMTKRVIDRQRFERWHYKNDPTHICFYSEQTFEWISQYWPFKLEVIDKDVVFLVRC